MRTATINLYQLQELQSVAKERAVAEHGNFLDSVPIEFEDENGKLLREYHEHTKAEIIESIEANEYYFFADGELAPVTRYCGNHPKAGQNELKFHGQVLIL
jgi:hypothetical protein